MRPLLIRSLLIGFLSILCLDAALWHLDPLGIRRHQDNLATLWQSVIAHPSGYTYRAGLHELDGWRTITLIDGTRFVPDTHPAQCIITFLGDSVTFGWGVNDHETFVNLLAQTTAGTQVVNAAHSGYSVENSLLSRFVYRAEGYVWLVIDNDAQPAVWHTDLIPQPLPPATSLYLTWLLRPHPPNPPASWGEYRVQADRLAQDNRVLVMGFTNDALIESLQQSYPQVRTIPMYREQISIVDHHPNARGHQQIAQAMQPYLADFVERICGK